MEQTIDEPTEPVPPTTEPEQEEGDETPID